MNRRNFLIKFGRLGTTVGLAGFFPFTMTDVATARNPRQTDGAEPYRLDIDKTVYSVCSSGCKVRCPLLVRISNNQIKYIENNIQEKPNHQIKPCIRGRANRYRVYNPRRLKYPMQRVGKRGEGKYQQISWDKAFELIAQQMRRIKQQYGNQAFYLSHGAGVGGGTLSKSHPTGDSVFARLFNLYGGYTRAYDNYCSANFDAGSALMFGQPESHHGNMQNIDNNQHNDHQVKHENIGNSNNGSNISTIKHSSDFSQIAHCDMVLLFGNNLSTTDMVGANSNHYLINILRQCRGKFITIDPRYTDTAMAKSNQWIAIRPGTDAALIAGIMHVLISENLIDQPFLDKYTIGFDEHTLPAGATKHSSYRSYIMGLSDDGVVKTAKWATRICGVPSQKIVQLARDIAAARRCFIAQGLGPQRHSNGDEIARSIMMLAAATGNIGKIGTNGGGQIHLHHPIPMASLPIPDNPVLSQISAFSWRDAVTNWRNMTTRNAGVRGVDALQQPLKMLINYGANPINQHADVNRTRQILANEQLLEFIVDINITMSPSSHYADLILPDATQLEQDDITADGRCGDQAFVILSQRAITPLWQSKTAYDIAAGIAGKLGLYRQFTHGRNQQQWLQHLWQQSIKQAQSVGYDLPNFQKMTMQGVFKITITGDLIAGDLKNPSQHQQPRDLIAYYDFINNPDKNPLPTKSGKIEILSQHAMQLNRHWDWDNQHQPISLIPKHQPRFNSYQIGTEQNDHNHNNGDPSHHDDHHLNRNINNDYSPKTNNTNTNYNPTDTGNQGQLQIISFHAKGHSQSSYYDIDPIREINPAMIWMNPIDAKQRQILHNDKITIWNQYGTMQTRVKLTNRIRPGVLAAEHGIWPKIKPSNNSNNDINDSNDNDITGNNHAIDIGGCFNTLTSGQLTSLAKAGGHGSTLVKVKRT